MVSVMLDSSWYAEEVRAITANLESASFSVRWQWSPKLNVAEWLALATQHKCTLVTADYESYLKLIEGYRRLVYPAPNGIVSFEIPDCKSPCLPSLATCIEIIQKELPTIDPARLSNRVLVFHCLRDSPDDPLYVLYYIPPL